MPPRIARASVAFNNTSAPKKGKNKNQKRALNAYASAARQIPEARLNRNRVGEDLDDGAKRKRSRGEESDGEDGDSEEDEEDGRQQRKKKKKVATKRGIAHTHDDLEHGSDSEGNEWTMGGLNDGAEGEEEESDLDSDEAFGESDEEKFAGFTFRGSQKKDKKNGTKKGKTVAMAGRKEVDLDESDEDMDEGDSQDDEGETFGEDGVDLATMLDDDPEEEGMNVEMKMKRKMKDDQDGGSGNGSESEEEDDDEEEDEEGEDEEEEEDDEEDDSADEEAVARNMDRIIGLDPSSKSSPHQHVEGITTLDDFMDGSIVPLAPVVKSKKSKKSKKKGEITQLAAKLPKRQQDRIDREVASAKAKEQLNRWQDTVKRNRREEFLTFPLQDSTDKSGITGKEKFLPSTQQAPQNELEASIQRIMEQSGLASQHVDEENVGEEEQALLKSEELATNQLPVEEVLRRRAELRKMRELLFREEIKAKRIAKIKSKSYRRVHRKEKEREAEKERMMLEGLGGGGQVMDEDEKERQDRKRAEARMGTKHKESKWAKSLKATGRAVWDEGARDGVVEQARREEELRKRIEGRDVSDDDSEGSLSPSEDDEGDDAPFMLRKLEGENSNGTAKKGGLAGMKFMREAEERKQRANEEDVARLRKELAVEDGEEVESEEGEESLGRALFGPRPTKSPAGKVKEQRLEFEAPDQSADEDTDVEGEDGGDDEVKIVTDNPASSKSKPKVQVGAAKVIKATPSSFSKPREEGWLRDIDDDDDDAKKSKSNKGWLQAPKGTSRKAAVASNNLDILKPVSHDPPAKLFKSSSALKESEGNDTSTTATNTSGWTSIPHPNKSITEEDGEEEQEQSNPILPNSSEALSLQQRAFAGDDVTLAFTQEKESQALSEDEQEISTHLPGWGNWTGDGLSRKIQKANLRAKHNPLFKTKLSGGVRAEERKDKNMQNVIISQKGDAGGTVRKGKKYLASQLPHEYGTKEEYERSRRMPVGVEWVTKGVHQRMTRPRVVVQRGVNVEALNRPVL